MRQRGRAEARRLARHALAVAVMSWLPLGGAMARAVDSASEPDPPVETREDASTAVQLGTVQVTGTRIRGGTTPSPVITIGSEAIRAEGFTDLGEVIRSLPQNFSGGQNPGVAAGATTGAGGLANQNVTGGSALNLRGLGPDATLTLLNGRRMAYGGFSQAVDIEAIPVEAVARIDVVPDGASAIYGSDAVGGVANVILKRDYEGLAVGMRYGGATQGGLGTREYTATAGTTWARGGLIATYKDVDGDAVPARQRHYTAHMVAPTTLYPEVASQSALVSAHQTIGASAELRLDALRTRRQQAYSTGNTGTQPWYNRFRPETTTSLVSPGLDVFLPGDWTLSAGASRGRSEHLRNQARVVRETGAATTVIQGCFCNEASSYEVGAEGPLFALAGGDARLAVGAGGRRNEYREDNHLTGATAVRGDERVRFAYAELNLPLVGPATGRPGLRRLDFNMAVRGEDYDTFGSVTTPKLGWVYGPSADITLKGSWGRSFKAPTLFQRYMRTDAVLDPASFYGGAGLGPDAVVLARFGGAPDLDAERATTWAASLVVHPAAWPGLEAELTWFDIDYTDRVVEPITDYGRALLTPHYAQFIELAPSAERQAGLIAVGGTLYNFTNQPYDPERVVALINGQYVNAARQRVRGLDLSAAYRFDAGAGAWTLRGSASWLDSTQQNSPDQAPYDIAGTLFNPARLSGRVGTVWQRGGVSGSVFANYTGGVDDRLRGERTASFTTFDTAWRYAAGQPAGVLSGAEVALSVQNLLDRDPPRYTAASIDRPPYDSTNYSAVGRFVSVSVSKHW
ncbi:TonB-dependent receptor plug domain-containing protein [Luteimonas abyssi]|uniref:TonB-dependent receptor plug domain-containing protein n=1 Tax=Luteimonas abyssi TaxID=1247514 RepID=UPI001EE4C5EB|nr:TonB-dependent receptor [Luteimonas abyssi]